MTAYGLDELRGLTLSRQFPEVGGRDARAAAEAVARVGPIQSQTARSTFVGLGARLPGLTHAAVTEAFETLGLVRGSSIRGTVHTSTPDQHVLLDAITRVGQRALWVRLLKLRHHDVEEVWDATEEFARDAWRSPDELADHLRRWLRDHGETGADGLLDRGLGVGRYLSFGHGGLVRRPLTGEWSGQGTAGYRTASAVVPERAAPPDPLRDAVRLHLASHGPASRHDVAWWSGLGLRRVDALIESLDVTWRAGPDGRSYADLPGVPAPRDLPGVRLLPEFDAVCCGYDPRARDRFVSTPDNDVLWHRANGFMLAPVLVDGRIGGHWRLHGTGRSRSLTVSSFPRSRRLRAAEVHEAAAALAASLDVTLDRVASERL